MWGKYVWKYLKKNLHCSVEKLSILSFSNRSCFFMINSIMIWICFLSYWYSNTNLIVFWYLNLFSKSSNTEFLHSKISSSAITFTFLRYFLQSHKSWLEYHWEIGWNNPSISSEESELKMSESRLVIWQRKLNSKRFIKLLFPRSTPHCYMYTLVIHANIEYVQGTAGVMILWKECPQM